MTFTRHEIVASRAGVEDLVHRVRRRLIAAEASDALAHLERLSPCELMILAERERKARPSELADLAERDDRRAADREKWRRLWARKSPEDRAAVLAANRGRYVPRAQRCEIRHCAADGCHHVFIVAKGDTRFCTARCRQREKMRRYRRRTAA